MATIDYYYYFEVVTSTVVHININSYCREVWYGALKYFVDLLTSKYFSTCMSVKNVEHTGTGWD